MLIYVILYYFHVNLNVLHFLVSSIIMSSVCAQVQNVLSHNDRVKSKVDHRLAEIEATIEKVHGVTGAVKSLQLKIDEAASVIDSLKPVAASPDQIKEQQEELKVGHFLGIDSCLKPKQSF